VDDLGGTNILNVKLRATGYLSAGNYRLISQRAKQRSKKTWN